MNFTGQLKDSYFMFLDSAICWYDGNTDCSPVTHLAALWGQQMCVLIKALASPPALDICPQRLTLHNTLLPYALSAIMSAAVLHLLMKWVSWQTLWFKLPTGISFNLRDCCGANTAESHLVGHGWLRWGNCSLQLTFHTSSLNAFHRMHVPFYIYTLFYSILL